MAACGTSADVPAHAQAIVGSEHVHVVAAGESLGVIAAGHAMTVQYLASLNDRPVGATLKVGVSLRIDDRHLVPMGLIDGVVVNVPQRLLFLVEQGRVAAVYPVAAGRPAWRTPVGQFRVATREIDPVWDVPASIQREQLSLGRPAPVRVPPGPENPLGDRWLGLDALGIGIHGTNAPGSIYRLSTHGCIRLQPAHARELYDRVAVGTPVAILYEPVLTALVDGQWWLEVHPDAYRLAGDRTTAAIARLEAAGLTVDPNIRSRIADVVARARGRPELLTVVTVPSLSP